MPHTNPNNNNNSNNNNSNPNRQSESPAHTIDSRDSTTGSVETIVDRSLSAADSLLQQQQRTLAQSVNTTNEQPLRQAAHDSLTNSQISMIRRHSASEEDHQQQQPQAGHQQAMPQQMQQQRQQQQQQQQQLQQLDAQSHIYSSPVYAVHAEQKPPPLKVTAASLLEAVDDAKKPKLISHEEFQQQLQAAAAARASTLDSRISKKQRFPAELIKIKDGEQADSVVQKQYQAEQKELQKRLQRKERAKRANEPPFPAQIVLGLVQLVLAISLMALGSLLWVREAALSTAGCGIWAGSVAAVAGSLGVVSIRKTQAAFLALSLVCIATSTLALAITGVGLSRDINRLEEKFDLLNANDEISAASGLVFTLLLHFLVSIASVYCVAVRLCARPEPDLNDVLTTSNQYRNLPLDQEKLEQYLKAMQLTGNEKESKEKLAAMWMYAAQLGGPAPPSSLRKIKLIPATTCGSSLPPALPPSLPHPTATMMLPAPPPPALAAMTGMPYHRSMSQPYIHSAAPPLPPPPIVPLMYAPHMNAPSNHHSTYRTQKSNKSADLNTQQRRRRAAAAAAHGSTPRADQVNATRRQRRKSDTDIVDRAEQAAFTYTGLDRSIADSFLARQELSNAGSHVDYTSSSPSSSSSSSSSTSSLAASNGGSQRAMSRTSSKPKIICRDVKM